MSAQQTLNTPWYGYCRVLNAAETRSNLDVAIVSYPLDIAMTGLDTWVWPLTDTPLINTKMYDVALPTAIL